MTLLAYNLLTFATALALFGPVNALARGYRRRRLRHLHREEDVFGAALAAQRALLRERFKSEWTPPLTVVVLGLAACPFLTWSAVFDHDTVRILVVTLCGFLAWKYLTADRELVGEKDTLAPKLFLLLGASGTWFFPSFIALFLYYWGSRPRFRGQERVRAVRLDFREVFFTGEGYVTVRAHHLRSLPIETG